MKISIQFEIHYIYHLKLNSYFVLQNSVKKKMTSLGLPTMPKLPKATKFWKKRSANISEYDPTFRVVYLGNVLTGWAKGKFFLKKNKNFQENSRVVGNKNSGNSLSF